MGGRGEAESGKVDGAVIPGKTHNIRLSGRVPSIKSLLVRALASGALFLLLATSITHADQYGTDWPLEPRCLFELNRPEIEIVELDSTGIDAIGRRYARTNERLISEIDSLFRMGAFGPEDQEFAARQARRSFRYRCRTAQSIIAHLLESGDTVFVTDEKQLQTAYLESYLHPGVFPLPYLERCYLGRGEFCFFYTLEPNTEPVLTIFQNHLLPAKVTKEKIKDWEGQCLKMKIPVTRKLEVDVLYQEVYAGSYRREICDVEGQAVEVLYVDDVRGQYVSKWGKHRVGAIVLWRSIVAPGDHLPARGWLGARVYFPDIKLKLPVFLPDVGFHDLRYSEYPQPIIEAEFARSELWKYSDWLPVTDDGFFLDWTQEGEIPRQIQEALPDL